MENEIFAQGNTNVHNMGTSFEKPDFYSSWLCFSGI